MSPTTALTQTLSSDAVHNRNCYAYFLQLKPVINDTLTQLFPELLQLQKYLAEEHYNPSIPFGNLYSSIIASLEQFIEKEEPLAQEQIDSLDRLIKVIYHNDNHILEHELAGWINELSAQIRPLTTNTSALIKNQLKNAATIVNNITPQDTGGLSHRLHSVFSPDFKPQLYTNIPTIKNFSYKTSESTIEYRFSTQAQRHNGHERVSPLFIRWLQINAKETSQEINHIYFNNLGYHRSELDIAGAKERDLTEALHQLEKNEALKVMVITLPAHEGLIATDDYKMTQDNHCSNQVFKEFLAVAQGKRHQSGISDFFISPQAREMLFKNSENEQRILTQLLETSFIKQGITLGNTLSTAQKQAIWVHFIKYELTEYIIDTVKPQSYNFSCKDAIDRGAVSSTYFNLIKSFEMDNPMSKEEFERSLDAAAAMVKGRGMNFHRKIIWNALDVYITANYDQLINDSRRSWLIYWRDMNCPHARVKQLIATRIEQSACLLNSLATCDTRIKQLGHELLVSIKAINDQNLYGKRLLLETIARTLELITTPTPSEKSQENYKKLADELKVTHPNFLAIAGIMEIILGVLLYIPTLGLSQKLINHGYITSRSGFFAHQREQLSNQMHTFIQELSV